MFCFGGGGWLFKEEGRGRKGKEEKEGEEGKERKEKKEGEERRRRKEKKRKEGKERKGKEKKKGEEKRRRKKGKERRNLAILERKMKIHDEWRVNLREHLSFFHHQLHGAGGKGKRKDERKNKKSQK